MGESDAVTMTEGAVEQPRSRVLATEIRCVLATLVMLARGQIRMLTAEVGRRVRFSDGTTSVIYRETAMRRRMSDRPVIIVVGFRLRLIGISPFWHALFRFESLFNTLLFAAHPGFQTKLWMTDRDTGIYRGLYEWNGMEAAVAYVETLRTVLRPWVETGSFAYRIVPFSDRDRFLDGGYPSSDGDRDGWWLPEGAVSW
jgi:hypothetical protein